MIPVGDVRFSDQLPYGLNDVHPHAPPPQPDPSRPAHPTRALDSGVSAGHLPSERLAGTYTVKPAVMDTDGSWPSYVVYRLTLKVKTDIALR